MARDLDAVSATTDEFDEDGNFTSTAKINRTIELGRDRNTLQFVARVTIDDTNDEEVASFVARGTAYGCRSTVSPTFPGRDAVQRKGECDGPARGGHPSTPRSTLRDGDDRSLACLSTSIEEPPYHRVDTEPPRCWARRPSPSASSSWTSTRRVGCPELVIQRVGLSPPESNTLLWRAQFVPNTTRTGGHPGFVTVTSFPCT